MSKRQRKQRKSGVHGRATPPGTRPRQYERAIHDEPAEPDLMADVVEALREDHPLQLLAFAAQLLEITREGPLDRFRVDEEDEERIDLTALLAMFSEVDIPETTALLSAVALLTNDDIERARIDRALAKRRHALPTWLTHLREVEVTSTWQMTHVLGDGDNIYIGLRWPQGIELTVIVYIDHNMGTLVKDAFVVPEPVEAMLAFTQEHQEDAENSTLEPLHAADVRTRITEAIDLWDHTLDPPESDTWPHCRAIVEWAVRQLPDGGSGYERPEWSAEERGKIADAFLGSVPSQQLDITEDEQRSVVTSLLWFGCDYPPCDPYRWSPVNVEIMLADWYPRKVFDTTSNQAAVPDVLRAFVRFCHAERNIDPALTDDTLASIDEFAPVFRELTKRGGSAVLSRFADMPPEVLARIAALGIPDDYFDIEDRSHSEWMLDELAERVGDHEVLDALDDDPLPDESFDWTDVPDDIVARVTTVLEWSDRYCDEQLSVEYRTVCRRLLRRVVINDPGVFRRKSRDDYAAAALVWLMGQLNDLFDTYGPLTVKEMTEFFGMKTSGSVSSKGQTLHKAARLPGWDQYRSSYRLRAGDPALLTSDMRRRIIERRDRYRVMDD